MQLSDLSEASGVSIASIKYYRRERLLPAGTRVTATRQDYEERHLERLRLIRILREAAGAPIHRIKQLTTILDDPDRPLIDALGDAHALALGLDDYEDMPPGPNAPDDPRTSADSDSSDDSAGGAETATERDSAEHPLIAPLLERFEWPDVDSAPRRALDSTLRMLESWDFTDLTQEVDRYAEPMAEIAKGDLQQMSRTAPVSDQPPSDDAVVMRAVAGTIGFDRVLRSLRLLGHAAIVRKTFTNDGSLPWCPPDPLGSHL